MKYRFLLRPAWLAAITALAVLTTAFVGLGMWQWSRAHRTHKLSPQAAAAYLTPVPLDRLLRDGSPASGDTVGQAVSVSGVFDGRHQLLVPDRRFPDGRTGYIVIAPLKLADGTVVVVSRGWSAQRVTPPPAPAGTVTVTGWLSAAEPAGSAPPQAVDAAEKDPAHLIASVDVATLVNTWPYTNMDQAYVNALKVAPAGPGAGPLTPIPAPAPPHASSWYILNVGYTLQWWLFGVVGLWWFATYVRRLANPAEAEDEEEDLDEDDDAEPGQESEPDDLTQPDLTQPDLTQPDLTQPDLTRPRQAPASTP